MFEFQPAANNVINSLWMLMESGVEELKLLQTAILLITINTVVQHDSLAKVGGGGGDYRLNSKTFPA